MKAGTLEYSTRKQTAATDAVESDLHGRSRRLVVVSNRVTTGAAATSGGLAVALSEALGMSGGLWFGWSGKLRDDCESASPAIESVNGYTAATVDLTPAEHEGYYSGFSNECLWPLLHYRLDLVKVDRQHMDVYFAVNDRLAKSLAAMVQKDDLVWVHDYHLIPFAASLRRSNVRSKIGFFLHIPFPPPEIFAAVPDHNKLARCLFAYDLVGFQTLRDRENFIRYAQEHCGARLTAEGDIKVSGRTVKVEAFPIGIDVVQFATEARRNASHPDLAGLTEASFKRIIGVDRLDYSKGLPERLMAIESLFEASPEYRNVVQYLQIATPTREGISAYDDIDAQLDRIIGQVNGRFGTFGWSPVSYIKRPTPRNLLAGLLRRCHVGLISPLRDGMNLVAKEYVAAQDPLDPGVLILSQFAGAAEQLKEALIVNPYDTESLAGAIRKALEMPKVERQARHAMLLDKIRAEDIDWWRQQYLDALTGEPPHESEDQRRRSTGAERWPTAYDQGLRA
jgi:trehalose 6-phosphate synthase